MEGAQIVPGAVAKFLTGYFSTFQNSQCKTSTKTVPVISEQDFCVHKAMEAEFIVGKLGFTVCTPMTTLMQTAPRRIRGIYFHDGRPASEIDLH